MYPDGFRPGYVLLGFQPYHLSFSDFRSANAARAERWHAGGEPWTGADWSNAMCGEAGEAANVVKKLRRIETGTTGHASGGDGTYTALRLKLGEELADTVIYADLLAEHYGIDLGYATVLKFNRVSHEKNSPERI
jgi:NTP pyrophosphatase (non-canonical NTP hydrolase)